MDFARLENWLIEILHQNGQLPKQQIEQLSKADKANAQVILIDLLESGILMDSGDTFQLVQRDLLEERYAQFVPKTLNLSDGTLVYSVPTSLVNDVERIAKDYAALNILSLRDAFSLLLDSATNEILIASPFLEFDGIAMYATNIEKAIHRGSSIFILTRGVIESEREDYTYTAKLRALGKLLDIFQQHQMNPSSQIQIRDYGFRLGTKSDLHYEGIHQKMLIVDGRFAYIGSGELRLPSFLANGEVGVIHTEQKAQFWREFFLIFWQRAREVRESFIRSKIVG